MAAKKRKRAGQFDEGFFAADFEVPPHVPVLVEDRHPAVLILGACRQAVVGESKFLANLRFVYRALAERNMAQRTSSGAIIGSGTAWFVCEPNNPMDPNAVAIFMEQVQVGYLSREAAYYWVPKFRHLERRYGRRVMATATIFGDELQTMIGVWVMLDTVVLHPES